MLTFADVFDPWMCCSIVAVSNLVDMIAYHSGLSLAMLTLVRSANGDTAELAPSPIGAVLQLLVRHHFSRRRGYMCSQFARLVLCLDQPLHD